MAAISSRVAVSLSHAHKSTAGRPLGSKPIAPLRTRANRTVVRAHSSGPEDDEPLDARAFRRALSKSKNYNRRVSGDEDVLDQMAEAGISAVNKGGLIATMKENGFKYQRGEIDISLAESYGFCWGVERAVQMAYEARKQYPEDNMHITNEIIHNPTVNKKLKEMEVAFIEPVEDKEGSPKDFSNVEEGDVVILPAFGASVQEMQLLDERGVQIVDTTCPWVSKVWNAVDAHKRKEFTSVIHGKYAHEETIATASFADKYIVIKNLTELEYVRNYIMNGGDKEEFLVKFSKAVSEGFDPDEDLQRVGLANQTTMLKGETEEMGKALQQTMMEKFGVEAVDDHFMFLDTICDATQERQDAMYKIVEENPDIVLVVGGWNSSNTSHLQEIAEHKGLTSYWVDQPSRIEAGNKITWLTSWGEMKTTENWLPEGKLRIAVTSGASTPDKVVEDVLDRVFATKEGECV
uniref:4-hydroxy-3-methylbut-2-enyl diphosphate reductase n=1 Tax=Pyramimonas obovata TaxID=1411642 RepID=A0A7S0RNL7_9CHLO